jgi:ribosomal protein L25 (general stress protein Ctc)
MKDNISISKDKKVTSLIRKHLPKNQLFDTKIKGHTKVVMMHHSPFDGMPLY